jgi:hypothetical protein
LTIGAYLLYNTQKTKKDFGEEIQGKFTPLKKVVDLKNAHQTTK